MKNSPFFSQTDSNREAIESDSDWFSEVRGGNSRAIKMESSADILTKWDWTEEWWKIQKLWFLSKYSKLFYKIKTTAETEIYSVNRFLRFLCFPPLSLWVEKLFWISVSLPNDERSAGGLVRWAERQKSSWGFGAKPQRQNHLGIIQDIH